MLVKDRTHTESQFVRKRVEKEKKKNNFGCDCAPNRGSMNRSPNWMEPKKS